jgi:hypothetical protein
MHGMANGLICARAVLTGQEPEYLDAPDEWLSDLKGEDGSPVFVTVETNRPEEE